MLTCGTKRSKLAGAFLVLSTLTAAMPAAEAAPRGVGAAEARNKEERDQKKKKRKRAARVLVAAGSSRRLGRWQIPSAPRVASRPQPREIALATAHAQLGKPYRWAGNGPSSFDCSGLARFAWAAAGVELPRTSSAQYAALKRIPTEDLQPGDLVFSGRGRVHHVGLYIGDGQMIHSPQSGRRVEIAPLRSNLIGAARPD